MSASTFESELNERIQLFFVLGMILGMTLRLNLDFGLNLDQNLGLVFEF